MKKLIFPLLLLLAALTACGGKSDSDLVNELNGKWDIDVPASVAAANLELSATDRAETEAILSQAYGGMFLEFNTADSEMTIAFADNSVTRAYSIISTEGTKITLKVDEDAMLIDLIDSGTIHVYDNAGAFMVFKKA